MSDNQYQQANTQGNFAIDYDFTINFPTGPTGALGPVLGVGDLSGQYMQVQRGASGIAGATGVTGTILVTTNDPFYGVYCALAQISISGQAAGTWTIEMGVPFQNAAAVSYPTQNASFAGQINTWTIPFTVFSSGVATDPPQNSAIFCHFRYQNGPDNT